MNKQDLKRLNQRIADVRGLTPHGDPLYRWVHSTALMYVGYDGSGHCVQMQQIDGSRWLIAMWMAPMPEAQWKAQFPDIGYPHQGMYYATDLLLCEGVQPNDEITDDVIRKLKAASVKTFRDCLDEIETSRARREKTQRGTISDIVDDSLIAFGNVPGKRGGSVSFGGYDVPLISNT